MRKEICFAGGMVLVLLLLGVVSGAGVGYRGYEGHPIVVRPGESGYTPLILQNMVGEEDLLFKIEISASDEINAELDDDEFLVAAGTHDTEARIYYEIPDNAQPGQTYEIFVSTVTTSPYLTGGIESGVGFDHVMPVVVEEEPPAQSPEVESTGGYAGFLLFLGIVVVVAGIVVYFVMRKKK